MDTQTVNVLTPERIGSELQECFGGELPVSFERMMDEVLRERQAESGAGGFGFVP